MKFRKLSHACAGLKTVDSSLVSSNVGPGSQCGVLTFTWDDRPTVCDGSSSLVNVSMKETASNPADTESRADSTDGKFEMDSTDGSATDIGICGLNVLGVAGVKTGWIWRAPEGR